MFQQSCSLHSPGDSGIFGGEFEEHCKDKRHDMRTLAIETSCDDTEAAVLEDGRKILSNVVSSRVAAHQKYGGVAPELASRKRMEAIVPIVKEAFESAGTG